jgi:hypothetical protein
MIGKLMNGEANDVLVVALSGTIAALAARGTRPASPGHFLSGVLSNPVPGREPSAAHGLSTTAAERGAAA